MADPDGRQTFYREVPVSDLGLAARRLGATVVRQRCPACGRAKASSGFFGVRQLCPACGSRFDRLAGNELISIPLGFFFACLVTFLAGLALITRYGFFEGVTLVLLVVGALTVVVTLRVARMFALWLLWMLGFVYPDRASSPGRHELDTHAEA